MHLPATSILCWRFWYRICLLKGWVDLMPFSDYLGKLKSAISWLTLSLYSNSHKLQINVYWVLDLAGAWHLRVSSCPMQFLLWWDLPSKTFSTFSSCLSSAIQLLFWDPFLNVQMAAPFFIFCHLLSLLSPNRQQHYFPNILLLPFWLPRLTDKQWLKTSLTTPLGDSAHCLELWGVVGTGWASQVLCLAFQLS